jgi:hypothetical protein
MSSESHNMPFRNVFGCFRMFFHSRKRRESLVRWNSASEKFKETVEMRPPSVVGCNSYDWFSFELRQGARVGGKKSRIGVQ